MSEERDSVRKELRSRFELRLDERVERSLRSRVHNYIPGEFFSAASSECRDLFITGHFYGCISLVQAVSEGIARFAAGKLKLPVVECHRDQVKILKKEPALPWNPRDVFKAFEKIHKDRNDFHHLNAAIEQDWTKLEQRAFDCLEALYKIESELFGYSLTDQGMVPNHPAFWPADCPNMLRVHVRS